MVTNQRPRTWAWSDEAEGWNASLNVRWAVIKMERDERADKERGRPEISRLEDEHNQTLGEDGTGGRARSVNEMLKELGMETEKKTGQEQEQDDSGRVESGSCK
ncbi:hypothetical protein EDD37DRAFT_603373 [Exophiala viscosa]|uniref:Uncharacterized protein n=1 Tax=Exophiala viscosa TaxID=2486360 RepID=A0AAN6DMP9_9EURO|nr:hypothetical protein EDD36DRAFT_423839 [Exophiala viscosa]KAI1628440.1 hypothetical protein EDD37DRAFT_603373 [Exophiala viscosa]